MVSTVIDWFAAGVIFNQAKSNVRRTALLVSILTNIGLLSYFKYSKFIYTNLEPVLQLLGFSPYYSVSSIILPVGISFYTFQTMSYTIDVYRGKIVTRPSFLDFAMYVSFFPQLVAGPIVRATHFLPQCFEKKRFSANDFNQGLVLLLTGIFFKVVLADTLLAPPVDIIFANADKAGTIEAWAAAAGFTCQIFFDFSGYSLCAIGSALCLGFSVPKNFFSPYGAMGFSDFWKRWHISLSSWLKDYLYISIGGNRKGTSRTFVNLLVTMLIGGLWHGASWLFVLWGGVHGLLLITEQIFKKYIFPKQGMPHPLFRPVIVSATILILIISWVIFRAPDVSTILHMFSAMFTPTESNIYIADELPVLFAVTLGTFLWHYKTRSVDFIEKFNSINFWGRVIFLGTLILAISLCSGGNERAFIYFQF